MNESGPSDAALAELLSLTVVVNGCGDTIYSNHLGQKHRVHGPAVITSSGNQYWYQNGRVHRVDGPAVDNINGRKMWFQNGIRHRTDGPAIEWGYGIGDWYLNGEQLTESEFNERIKTI